MRIVLLILAVFAVPAIVFFVALTLLTSDEKTNCAEVRDPKPGAWQAGDFDAREQIVEDLSFCERL